MPFLLRHTIDQSENGFVIFKWKLTVKSNEKNSEAFFYWYYLWARK